jgi:hypothetical protein
MDTPVSMHTHCSRCAATPSFPLGVRTNIFPLRLLPESCLLHWIQSSQENQTRVEKAFKCPQCGADYEIESDNPLLLRILNKLNGSLTRTGKVATLIGAGTTVVAFGACMFSQIPHRTRVWPKSSRSEPRYLLVVHILRSLGGARVFGSGDVSSSAVCLKRY